MNDVNIKKYVREGYAKIAAGGSSCCGPQTSSCRSENTAEDVGRKIGYSDEELGSVPEGANLGLGCGNPTAIASITAGDTVLDLGSGAGFDCFLAAEKAGSSGKVIGVDMTPEMVDKARNNARKGNYGNVEFRLGEIEHLPVADNSVDIVISNCVINLSPDKHGVFQEAFRALKPGGRLMVSDIVLLRELPQAIKDSVSAYIGCLAGASMKDDYLEAVRSAGFVDVSVHEESSPVSETLLNDPVVESAIQELQVPRETVKEFSENTVKSISLSGMKPR